MKIQSDTRHVSAITVDEAVKISQEVRCEGGCAEQWLRDKCNWEHMSRAAVIMCWGDPRKKNL